MCKIKKSFHVLKITNEGDVRCSASFDTREDAEEYAEAKIKSAYNNIVGTAIIEGLLIEGQ